MLSVQQKTSNISDGITFNISGLADQCVFPTCHVDHLSTRAVVASE